MGSDVAAVGIHKAAEGGNVHEHPLEEGKANEGAEDSGQNIYNIVVGGVDSGEPDAETDDGEEHPEPDGAAGTKRVDEGHEHIGGMERREGGKHIGVARIEPVEYPQTCHLIKRSEPCHLTGGTGDEVEAVERHIPWRSGRMNIVEGEAQEVDKQKHQRKVEIDLILPTEIKPEAEEDGDGHPAEIEHSGHEVEEAGGVEG